MSSEIPDEEFFGADWAAAGVTLPFGFPPGHFPATVDKHGRVTAPGGDKNVGRTKDEWLGYQFNPPEFLTGEYPDPDPNAPLSLPYETVVRAVQLGRIGRAADMADEGMTDTAYHRRELTDAATLEAGGKTLRVNDGLDHITGLLAMVEHASTAGAALPHTVLQDGDRQPAPLWTEAARREVLAAAAHRENLVETAHAEVRRQYQAQAAIRDDETKTLDEREAAAAKALEIAEDYPAQLAAAMAAYDPDALPSGLADLREVLGERIEAAAMRRVKEIKGAKTQQGVDLPAACIEVETALASVTTECQLGIQAVDAAADNAAAQAAYDAALAKIAAVTPLNVPEWSETVQGRKVTVRAAHPAGATITGRVTLTSWAATDANGDHLFLGARLSNDGPAIEWVSTLPANAAWPVTLEFAARNLCGPSRYELEVADPGA